MKGEEGGGGLMSSLVLEFIKESEGELCFILFAGWIIAGDLLFIKN